MTIFAGIVATTAQATPVQINACDSVLFTVDFGALDLSAATDLTYSWTVTDLSGVAVTTWSGSVGAYHDLPPGAPDVTSTEFDPHFELDKNVAFSPGLFDDEVSFIKVDLSDAVDAALATIPSVLISIAVEAYAVSPTGTQLLGTVDAYFGVPLPATLLLLGSGAAGMAGLRRCRMFT